MCFLYCSALASGVLWRSHHFVMVTQLYNMGVSFWQKYFREYTDGYCLWLYHRVPHLETL